MRYSLFRTLAVLALMATLGGCVDASGYSLGYGGSYTPGYVYGPGYGHNPGYAYPPPVDFGLGFGGWDDDDD